MKLKHFIAALALSTTAAMSAQAAVISGWDFSQWVSGGGLLSIDGATFTNTLGANYSNLDPSFNAGPDSGVYGTMYMNGQLGSASITPVGDGSEAFLPFAGSLSSNLNGILPNPFDSLTIQIAQGAFEANTASMLANAATSVVFSATPGAGLQGDTWSVAFGAKSALAGGTITVEFSTDGVAFASVGTANVGSVDTLYSFALGSAASSAGYVRLGFSGAGLLLDNVAISATVSAVPEPATASLLGLGLAGLGYLGRRRKA
jgi:PEP-CTERM motif